jgi:coenzyme F420-0:L-glutamate ligase / coenzyme F420-1:gamma-L-glutamate ligase
MSDRIQLESIPNMPLIVAGDDIGQIVLSSAETAGFQFQEKDIICVASKAVSIAEGRSKLLSEVAVSEVAQRLHEQIPRKDPRTIQAIIDETGDPSGSRIDARGNFIGGWLPNGLYLTSAGVDKHGQDEVILLPEDSDASAREIGKAILQATGINVGVIITDSDGRMDKRGSTQIAIGVYGVPPIRTSESVDHTGKSKRADETICDMFAASAALLMGQRGTHKPVVVIRGFDYEFDANHNISEALNQAN